MRHSDAMEAVSTPTPLRLAGFLATVASGAFVAFGSISDWAKTSVGASTANAVPTKGVDIFAGKVMLAIGIVILLAIPVMRTARDRSARRTAARGIAIAALGAIVLSVLVIARKDSVFHDSGVDKLVALAQSAGASHDQAQVIINSALEKLGIAIKLQLGIWLALVGGALGLVGAALSLRWASREEA